MSEQNKAITMFLVVVNHDGTLTTYGQIPSEFPEVEREANNYDVFQASKQISEEFETSVLVDRIVRAVVSNLSPAENQVPSRLMDALKERGINPESIV